MRISEVIAKLEAIRAKHGDDVGISLIFKEGYYRDLEAITFMPASDCWLPSVWFRAREPVDPPPGPGS